MRGLKSLTGRDLRKMRSDLGLRYDTLGQALGVHPTTVRAWEREGSLGARRTLTVAGFLTAIGKAELVVGMVSAAS